MSFDNHTGILACTHNQREHAKHALLGLSITHKRPQKEQYKQARVIEWGMEMIVQIQDNSKDCGRKCRSREMIWGVNV